MNRLTLGLACMLLAALAGLLGNWYGYGKGKAAGELGAQARHDSQAVSDLTQLLTNNSRLIADANTASQRLRQATQQLSQANTALFEEFNHALNQSAASRAGCVFDAGSLRQLDAARQRAAAAASGLPSGNAAAVPATGAPAREQRR